MNIQGIFLVLFTLLSKIAGFSRDLVLSYYYGASNIVDAYIIATTIPMVIFSFVGTGIQTSLIPMLNKVKNENCDVERFVSNVINFFVLICIIAIVLIMIFTKPVVGLFASGFDSETMALAVSFTRFSIVGIVFTTLTYIFTSVLQYNNKFIAAAFSTILLDIIVLVFVILSHYFGTIFLPVGNVVAFFGQAMFLFILVKHKHKKVLDLKDENLSVLIKTILPVVIGASVNQINLLIDQTFASRVMMGAISYLNFANKVFAVVQGVFVLSFISLVYPKMVEISSQNIEKLQDKLSDWLVLLEFFVIPCAICFLEYAKEIIEFLFMRGNFTQSDSRYTALVLFVYSLQLPFYSGRELIVRVYYANRNTKLPLLNSIIGLIVNLLIIILTIKKIGLAALPLSTSISCFATFLFILIKYIKDYSPRKSCKLAVSMALSSVIFSLVFLVINQFVKSIIKCDGFCQSLSFIAEILISLTIYILVLMVVLFFNPKLKRYIKV